MDIKQANARIDLARAAVTVSQAELTASVDVGGGYSRSRASGTIDNALPKRMMSTWSVATEGPPASASGTATRALRHPYSQHRKSRALRAAELF
ncbi:hypothetical protein J8I87_00050 [Paraburkholderia sp. LEh10]|nr:hypothetical protein [Paraburkholderia sp. LEh10]